MPVGNAPVSIASRPRPWPEWPILLAVDKYLNRILFRNLSISRTLLGVAKSGKDGMRNE